MDKIEAALEILFADNLVDLERSRDTGKLASALSMSPRWDFMTDHWRELREAAKSTLLETLRRVPAAPETVVVAVPASDSLYARFEITYRDHSSLLTAIKIVRADLGLGLREAKEFVQDHNPPYIEIKREVAVALQEKLLAINVRAKID